MLRIAGSRRVASLDALRGVTIALMLLVNNVPAGVKPPVQFQHAGWGEMIHLADLVFPWLLFCVGAALPLSRASFLRRKLPAWRYYTKIAQRAAILFSLGCVLQSSLAGQLSISLGVLQLIALAYLLAAAVAGRPRFHRLLTAVAMLVSYWALIRYTLIPGQQAGAITETDNVIYFLNETVFGPFHLWGLTSIIPTTALVLLGTLAGDWIRSTRTTESEKVIRLLTVGVVVVGAGFWWNVSVPFSKALWSPAYILLTAGLAYGMLGLLYALLDWAKWQQVAHPFTVFGSNAILAYVAPILAKVFILKHYVMQAAGKSMTIELWAQTTLTAQFGAPAGAWTYAGLFIATWWLILWLLHKKRWYIRV